MSEAREGTGSETAGLSREQRMSAVFAGLVVNQGQMALMLMGRMPHPMTGQTTKDLEGAQLFIDQLEMLEEKTKGNLDPNERKLLRDHLTALRLAFVEAAEERGEPSATGSSAAEPGAAGRTGDGPREAAGGAAEVSSAVDGESRKKFSKKY